MVKLLLLFTLFLVTPVVIVKGSLCSSECGGKCYRYCAQDEVQLQENLAAPYCGGSGKVCCVPNQDRETNTCYVPGPPKPLPVPASECKQYPCLIFEDEFDTLNLDTWQHEITANGAGNWEFEYYTNNRSNSYVRNGVLYIKPTLTADRFGEDFLYKGKLNLWGSDPADACTSNKFNGCEKTGSANKIINPIQSARIRSVHSFSMRYGRVEFEAQMPRGDWLWPAVWMLPLRKKYGRWPASGEIDLIESKGNDKLIDDWGWSINNRHMSSTLMWGPFWPQMKGKLTQGKQGSNYADAFHKWRMDWDENSIIIYVDEEEVLNVSPPDGGFWDIANLTTALPGVENPWQHGNKMAPFDQEFYFILNVAVGGQNGFFPDVPEKPWKNSSPTAMKDFWEAKDQWYPTWNGEDAAMKVNYIRAWKLEDN